MAKLTEVLGIQNGDQLSEVMVNHVAVEGGSVILF